MGWRRQVAGCMRPAPVCLHYLYLSVRPRRIRSDGEREQTSWHVCVEIIINQNSLSLSLIILLVNACLICIKCNEGQCRHPGQRRQSRAKRGKPRRCAASRRANTLHAKILKAKLPGRVPLFLRNVTPGPLSDRTSTENTKRT